MNLCHSFLIYNSPKKGTLSFAAITPREPAATIQKSGQKPGMTSILNPLQPTLQPLKLR